MSFVRRSSLTLGVLQTLPRSTLLQLGNRAENNGTHVREAWKTAKTMSTSALGSIGGEGGGDDGDSCSTVRNGGGREDAESEEPELQTRSDGEDGWLCGLLAQARRRYHREKAEVVTG